MREFCRKALSLAGVSQQGIERMLYGTARGKANGRRD